MFCCLICVGVTNAQMAAVAIIFATLVAAWTFRFESYTIKVLDVARGRDRAGNGCQCDGAS